MQRMEAVLEAIWNALQEAPSPPDPAPARGEGRQAESDSSPKIGSGKQTLSE